MHAFLVIGEADNYINSLFGKKIDFGLSGIDDVRELNSFTKLKISEETIIVVKDFDKATEETQNAFLKALEEPQEKLKYVLTVQNIDKVLQTIVSRCEVVDVCSMPNAVSSEDREKTEKFTNLPIGEKLKITSKINKREEAVEFVKNLILVNHGIFLKNPEMMNFLSNANRTLMNLEANGNVQLQLTNFVVGLD